MFYETVAYNYELAKAKCFVAFSLPLPSLLPPKLLVRIWHSQLIVTRDFWQMTIKVC